MKASRILAVFLLVLLAVSFSTVEVAPAEQPAGVTLAWDANIETDLAGYKIHFGNTSGEYTSTVDVGNVTTHTVNCPDPLTEGHWFFVATAYDISGNESGYSNEVGTILDWTAPASPSGCRLQIKWPD